MREGNRRALVPTVQAPTLVQWSKLNEWVPLRHGERFAKELPDARLVGCPGVGPVPHEELPDQTARDALEFLAEPTGD